MNLRTRQNVSRIFPQFYKLLLAATDFNQLMQFAIIKSTVISLNVL